MPELKVIHGKAECLYDNYDRKDELQHQTHYCPGCGHGVAHKLLAEVIDELGIRDRVILVSPVGCSVFAYYYFDVGNVQVAHGRAPAVATGLKRSHPDSIVITYQGDGDLAAIGSAEIMHAANRSECFTALFVNNAIYGMTGGQCAPTSLLGDKTTTTPFGRTVANDGYPLKASEMLAALDGPVFIERGGLGNVKQILQTKRAIKRALETQIKGLGFSLVEILSPCPTIWKLDPVDAQRYVRDVLTQVYPLGNKLDRTSERAPRMAMPEPPPLSELPRILKLPVAPTGTPVEIVKPASEYRIKVAGFGGQGVLLLGQLIAEAGMDDGLDVSWLPSYGPEMRSGTSNCHVRLSTSHVDSPLVSRPNVLIAMNEPSLRKFIATVDSAGLVLYNGDSIPPDCFRTGITMHALPFAAIADELGSPKVANIVVLGAFLAATNALPLAVVDRAMARVVKGEKWLEIDRRAMARGHAEMQKTEVRVYV